MPARSSARSPRRGAAPASLRYLLGGAFFYGVLELILAPQTSRRRGLRAAVLHAASAYISWGATALTAIQLEAPEHLRGRAASLYFWAFLGGAPIGGLFAGWLVSVGGTELAFAVAGTIAVTTAVVGNGAAAPRERPLARERAGAGVAVAVVTAIRLISTSHRSMTSLMRARGQPWSAKERHEHRSASSRHAHVRERPQAPQLPPLLLPARRCRSPATGCSRSRPRGCCCELTDSAVAVGVLALAMLLPTTLLGLFVGTIIDRFDVRRTTIACEVLSGADRRRVRGADARRLDHRVGDLRARRSIGGVVAALDGPARHALVFQMVGSKDLPNAVALMSSLGTTARVLGPAIGGFVVAFAGPGTAFALNAASYVVIVGCLLALDRSRLLHAHRDTDATVLGGAADSLRFIGNSRRALVAFIAVFALSTLLVQLQRAAAARRRQDAALGRGGVRPDRGGVRSRSAVRLDDQRDRRPREPASAADRRGRLRLLRAAARAAALAARSSACCSS